jgi:hypothetical protein
VVECAALEMRFTGNGNVGSNPTLSANIQNKLLILNNIAPFPKMGPTIGPICRNGAIGLTL